MKVYYLKKINIAVTFALAVAVYIFISYPAPLMAASANGKKAVVKYPDYIIGPEDILEISVWKNKDLSREVTVRPDGKISLPLIGDVTAGGLTPVELRHVIVKKLNLYQQTVEASVIVSEINSYKIFVFGDVIRPGIYNLKRRTSLIQAIAIAGGFNQFASRNKIIIIREILGGSSKRFIVRLDDILYKKDFARKNLILNPGDTIFVP